MLAACGVIGLSRHARQVDKPSAYAPRTKVDAAGTSNSRIVAYETETLAVSMACRTTMVPDR